MKKNAKLAALAILVLAAVAALSVGITLAVVNARMPAACTCGGQCRSAGTETAAAGDAPSAQQTMSAALGQQLGQVAAQMISKNLSIAPTLEIRPGYRFNVVVVKDLTFSKPYASFDY